MWTFIDESGPFIPLAGTTPNISCVAALVIPSSQADDVFANFSQLRSSWGYYADEVKGSKLDENQINAVIRLLQRYEVILNICCMDTGTHSKTQIVNFRDKQAKRLLAHLTPEHQDSLAAEMNILKYKMMTLSAQLFAQLVVSITLIEQLIQEAILYYGFRFPAELSDFRFVCDAKNTDITTYEELWQQLIIPIMACRDSIYLVEEVDYTHFQKYLVTVDKQPYHWQKARFNASKQGIDGKKLLGDFTFSNSQMELGLQLVDIMANAFRRGMNGNLQESGWTELGSLIVEKPGQGQVATMLRFENDPSDTQGDTRSRNYQGYVLQKLHHKVKPMFL